MTFGISAAWQPRASVFPSYRASMDWWNNFISWLTSADARSTLFIALVIAVAMLISSLIASSIAKAGIKRLVAQRDREQRAAAIAALIDAATEATVWNSLTPQEQVLADRAVGQADTIVRLLPVRGSAAAADWAAHQLSEMKRASATFGYQLDPVIAEFRDRLLEWQERPARAKKIFQGDLERWELAEQQDPAQPDQDAWVAQQHHEAHARPNEAGSRLPSSDTDPTTQKLMDDVAALDASKKKSPSASETDEKSA